MMERRNSPAALFSCGNVYSWLPERSIKIAMFIGRLASRLKVKTSCGRPSSNTDISSWRMSPTIRLLRSTALKSTLTSSVPSLSGSSFDEMSSSLAGCFGGRGLCWEDEGGFCPGLDFCCAASGPAPAARSSRNAVAIDTTLFSCILNRSLSWSPTGFRGLVIVAYLVEEMPLQAHQLHLDLPVLARLLLIVGGVIDDVLLPQVLRDLAEGSE